IVEERPPLAAAIHQVEDEALARGAVALAILLPDTPLVTVPALTRAVHTLGPVVVAPARNETGTNLLLRRPPTAIGSNLGRDSYRRHLEAAGHADVPIAVVEQPEIAFDVDHPDDILTVLSSRRAGRSRQVLRELDLSGRLGAAAQEG